MYRAFISSPGDLASEREVVKAAVQSVSESHRRKGIRVEPWLWEVDAVSEFGDSPQDIINKQIGKYDIYIGLMGARFGSPTDKFGSATEQEFYEALAAHGKGTARRISFIFKEVPTPVSALSSEELAQAQKVKEFKERIGPLGLYSEFKEEHQLSLLIQKIINEAVEEDMENDAASGHQFGFHTPPGNERNPVLSETFFAETLNRLDEDLTNGVRIRLTLEDVWVDPELQLVAGIGSDDPLSRKKLGFKSLVMELAAGKSFIAYGSDTSGKSSLCRKAFLGLWDAGFFPGPIKS